MTIKELMAVNELKKEICEKRERYATVKAMVSGIAAGGGYALFFRSNDGGYSDKTAQYASELCDLESELLRLIAQRTREYIKACRYIESIPDSRTRRIFSLRFLDGLTWDAVAAKIGGGNAADGVRKTAERYVKRNGNRLPTTGEAVAVVEAVAAVEAV